MICIRRSQVKYFKLYTKFITIRNIQLKTNKKYIYNNIHYINILIDLVYIIIYIYIERSSSSTTKKK